MRFPLRVGVCLSASAFALAGGACRREASTAEVAAPQPAPRAVGAGEAGAPSLIKGRPTTAQLLARVLDLAEITDAEARKREMSEILSATTGEERALLLEALWALGDDRGARARFAELFTLWCDGDPESAARWAVSMWDEIPGRDGEKLREEAGFLWAKRAFEPAFAWALTLRDVTSEWGLAAKMLKEVALRDPRRALALARGVSAEFFDAAKNRIFAGWIELDPAAAFAELGVACKDSSMFPHRLGVWANVDPVAAVRWSLENDSDWLGSLSGFVKDRGALVTALFDAKIDWSKAKRGRNELPSFLNNWIREDAARALAWIDALPESAEKTALIAEGAKHRSWDAEKKFLPTAVPLIMRLPAGEDRDALLRSHLKDWGRTDAEAVLKWIKENDAPASVTDAAVIGAMSGLAKDDPKAALDYVETLAGGDLKVRAEKELAAGWASTDAKAAAEWLKTRQPDWLAEQWGSDSIDQKYRLAAAWLEADPDAMFAWAATQENQAEAEAILGNAAGELASMSLSVGDPDLKPGGTLSRAVGLLLRMPEASASRRGQLSAVFANLLQWKKEPEARALLDAQTGLSATQKREILESARQTLESWKAMAF